MKDKAKVRSITSIKPVVNTVLQIPEEPEEAELN